MNKYILTLYLISQATRDQYSPILSDYNVVWSEPASTSALLAALCAPCRTSTSPLNPSEGSRWKEGQERPAVNVNSTNEHIPDVYSETAEGLTSTYWTFPQQDQASCCKQEERDTKETQLHQ